VASFSGNCRAAWDDFIEKEGDEIENVTFFPQKTFAKQIRPLLVVAPEEGLVSGKLF
jgi:hypothetical protein